MPAKDSMNHRGASAVRGGRRFAPYQPTDGTALTSHSSCPDLSSQLSLLLPSPQDSALDSVTEISSTVTLVNNSFGPEKWDSPPNLLASDKFLKPIEKVVKFQQRQAYHQKKVDFVAVLIDFTCKTLREIWPISSVPAVFRYQCGATFGYSSETAGFPVDAFEHSDDAETDLIILRKFVQELLRRSRSTCTTLQTALCYIEAIRHKVPQFQLAEKEGRGIRGDQVNNDGRIEVDPAFVNPLSDSLGRQQEAPKPSKLRKPHMLPETPLPALPSALLCPRRAFMGALVLSAKFVQDKCYSNRAWAKLCGLPAREVSRCERALGDALEWRLWVGKDTAFPFAGIESKIGRAPTMSSSCLAVQDRRDLVSDKPGLTPLGRAHTWPSFDVVDSASATQTLLSESDLSISPTPSLTVSTSGYSSFSEGLTPSLLSPSPSFVPSDPYSHLLKRRTELARFKHFDSIMNASVFDAVASINGDNGESFTSQFEQDAIGIRVGDAIEVV